MLSKDVNIFAILWGGGGGGGGLSPKVILANFQYHFLRNKGKVGINCKIF